MGSKSLCNNFLPSNKFQLKKEMDTNDLRLEWLQEDGSKGLVLLQYIDRLIVIELKNFCAIS